MVMKKRFTIELGMLIFISLLVVIVSISGVITYKNLLSLSNDLEKGGQSDKKLAILKQVTAELYQTESNVRTYYFTRDSAYLHDYNNSKNGVEIKLAVLESYVIGDILAKLRLDSIKELVQSKYLLLDTWITMDMDEEVTKELNKLPEKLNSENNKNIVDDTSIKKKKKKSSFDMKVVEDEVRKIQKRQANQLRELNQQELVLNIKNKVINDALRSIVTRMEKEEKESIKAVNSKAIKKANTTNFIIAVFCISSVFLLIVIGTILLRYILKTKEYNQALKNARMEAENLAVAKQSFLANMTHEIRTPINSIIGFTEQLDKSEMTGHQKEHLHIIKKSSMHLLKIVNDVLDYSKLQSGKFTFERIIFNPSETIQEVIDILSPEAEHKNIQVQFKTEDNIPQFILGDPFRLQQILLNIIGNAIKFTGSGTVAVGIRVDMLEGKEVLFKMEIKDTGIGIPENKINKVFEDFEQAETTLSKRYKGTGLGLSISKKLVENQGGNIHILSKEGEGTIVSIVIPYELVTNVHGETNIVKAIDSTFLEGKRVLIVDDEPFNRKLLKTILIQWGAFVDEVHDGENALFMVNTKHYHLILMDIRMPGMSGIEITKKIRKHENAEKKNIIIIALTASNDPEKEKKCLEAGMNAFLPKPFNEQRLFELISEMLSKVPSKIHNDIQINVDELYKIGNGDKVFVNEMLGLFLKGAEEGIYTIKNAVKIEDRRAMMEITHKIAPSCRHIGAKRMLELLKMLEKQAELNASMVDLNILIHELEKETLTTMNEVKKHIF